MSLGLRSKLALTLVGIAVPMLAVHAVTAAWRDVAALHRSMFWFGESMAQQDRSDGRRPPRRAGPNGAPLRKPIAAPPAVAPQLNPRGEARRYHLYDDRLECLGPRIAELPGPLREPLASGTGPVTARETVELPGESRPVHAFYTAERFTKPDGEEVWLVVDHYQREPVGRPLEHLRAALPQVGLVLLATFFALGPLVRRIRRTTRSVEAARPGEPLALAPAGQDELSRLTRAFDAVWQESLDHWAEARRRDEALRRFVANTVHDVAVPLSTLQGHLARLEGGSDARAAQRDAEYIASLIENLSSVARLEADADDVAFLPTDLAALVERVALRHEGFARSQGLEFGWAVPDGPVPVAGDLTLLERALSNLVQNAVRHGRAGGHVALTLDARDGHFELKVVDDGPGLPADVVAWLDASTAAESCAGNDPRPRGPSGRGLGLSITREVLARHGFEFGLESAASGVEAQVTGPLLADVPTAERGAGAGRARTDGPNDGHPGAPRTVPSASK